MLREKRRIKVTLLDLVCLFVGRVTLVIVAFLGCCFFFGLVDKLTFPALSLCVDIVLQFAWVFALVCLIFMGYVVYKAYR